MLVPIYNVGVKHITLDSGAVLRMIVRAEDTVTDPFPENPEPVNRSITAYEQNRLVLWQKCFNIPRRLLDQNKFACSISTNGVDVSIHCARQKTEAQKEDDKNSAKRRKMNAKGRAKTREFAERRELRATAADYGRLIGIDPGKK